MADLRTTFAKIIHRAGLSPWPKLFQNLRASRATELASEHPAHVAAAWLGHSTIVANKHYWQVTDADVDHAAKSDAEAAQIPAQKAHATPRNRSQQSLVAEPADRPKPLACESLRKETAQCESTGLKGASPSGR
jgi:hypothetical protein